MTIMQFKGIKEAPKSVSSQMDTLLITPDLIETWVIPPFQRPLKVNAKVRAIAEDLKHNGGVVSGILTLGRIRGEKTTYLMDGQHRVEAGKQSCLKEMIADVRVCTFDSLAEMGAEYVKLNSAIVRMNPDDMLRGMEGVLPVLHNIRDRCPFVGYDNVRRNPDTPLLSMSSACRTWMGTKTETPKLSTSSALEIVSSMTIKDGDEMSKFLGIAHIAWGNDAQHYRLWTSLNLCLSMWLWRRLVLDTERSGSKRYVVVTAEQFKKCLMRLSANGNYIDWLVGRPMNDRNRSPGFSRIKTMFVESLRQDGPEKIKLPSPAWAAE